jgi:hypothetical protein
VSAFCAFAITAIATPAAISKRILGICFIMLFLRLMDFHRCPG